MEASCANGHHRLNLLLYNSINTNHHLHCCLPPRFSLAAIRLRPNRSSNSCGVGVRLSKNLAVTVKEETLGDTASLTNMLPKIDRSGRFCNPRAARELALLMLYAACLEGSDPVRLFEKRLNAPREQGYEFDKSSLLQYNHMSFGGPPVSTDSYEEADQLMHQLEAESAGEEEVLSAPPRLVYSKLLLRLTRKLLVAVVERWDCHVMEIEKIAPANWKNEPAGRIVEFSILHLAMSEISVLGTRHQIVINEAVDLAKRFCDGGAPRIINGCLRNFLRDFEGTSAQP